LALWLKVALALLVMTAGLWWARGHWDWLHLGVGVRVGGIAAVVGVAASVYGLSLWLMGVPLREFLRRAA
jgi:peptidoglycan biosynthesis protein MviN/MurJ (putative lipid II flippase)